MFRSFKATSDLHFLARLNLERYVMQDFGQLRSVTDADIVNNDFAIMGPVSHVSACLFPINDLPDMLTSSQEALAQLFRQALVGFPSI
jgi:hypothetical protein